MITPLQTTHCRLGRVSAAVLIVLAVVAVRPAAAAEGGRPIPRVRTNNPSIAALIELGRDRSTTFRHLLETIEASDGLVYIEDGRCHGRPACLLPSVTVAGPNRILHVRLNTRATERDLIGSIGHELRHAIEVLSDPAVTSDAAIYNFYLRNYPSAVKDAFETKAAIDAGLAVRAELSKK